MKRPVISLMLFCLSAVIIVAMSPAAHAQGLPIGQPYRLTSMGQGVAVAPRPTLTIARKDSVLTASGDTGCNLWSGTLVSSGEGFRLANTIVTERACADESAMRRERAFLSALESVKRWRMDGKVLVLEGDRGMLRFEPAAKT